MTSITTTLIHGLLICIPFTLLVVISFRWNPRLWLHSLHPDIIQRSTPKTKSEKDITRYVLLPLYFLVLPGLSTLSLFCVAADTDDLLFLNAFLHLYGIWIIVHLWDLIVIDGGYLLFHDKNQPPITGTEGAAGWTDFSFHVRSFLKAVLMSALFVVPVATLVSFFI